ncbi:unnamed protein product, partial [marine sediment metagenome]
AEEVEEAKEVKEAKKESQTENFIFEDIGTVKYAQIHDYEATDSVRVIPRKKDDKWEVLALSVKEKNLDRLDEALSTDRGYTLVTRKIIVEEERAPVLLREYKRDLEAEFPKAELLKRIESLKKELEASKS